MGETCRFSLVFGASKFEPIKIVANIVFPIFCKIKNKMLKNEMVGLDHAINIVKNSM